MWHRVTEVARIYKFNELEFTNFAVVNRDKYHLVIDSNGAEVNTWNVDNLIRDFRKEQEKCPKEDVSPSTSEIENSVKKSIRKKEDNEYPKEDTKVERKNS